MSKTVIIQSIGSANPSIAKVIADAFEINHELLVRQLYNAPSLFLENVAEDIATRAAELLSQLGLEILVQDASLALPQRSEPIDIAVHIQNPLDFRKVAKQLAEFLGCKENDALNLLLNEPSVVLGNVSMATATTLQRRLDAEVIASNPRKDMYTVILLSQDKNTNLEITNTLKNVGIKAEAQDQSVFQNIPYTKAQEIWSRYHQTKKIAMYNQSYQRFKILLKSFDLNDSVQTAFLINEIGMPEEALEMIFENLPVVLEESLNKNEATEKLTLFTSKGLDCSNDPIPFGKYKIAVDNIEDAQKFQEIVSQFYKDIQIDKNINKWVAPLPIDSLLNRYLEKQLEYIGCDVTHQYQTT